ncbi:hypothetical protein BZG36_04921 [Bifiguratus adelaidae]|uniref:Phosphatidylcholine transfer protein n=1 Tax=Bifiguratus adelaidae TaxID=1938954 RepID=A0A261XX45_9FUNG|nr:hypothetical protein BZG36_04921 [Bifiguratus adelaidae]
MTFQDSDFVHFASQLAQPDLNGWDYYIQTPDFKVYRKKSMRNPNLFEYKCIGAYKNVKPHVLARVYLDLEYRRQWDRNMLGYQELRPDKFHYTIKYPWPMSNRDYVYEIVKRKVVQQDGSSAYVILGDSIKDHDVPVKNGVVRIDNYLQKVAIHATEDGNGSAVVLDYFDDPKGNIPTAVINWAAKTGVPGFMKSLQDACIKFQKDHPDFTPDTDETTTIQA